MFQKLRRLCEIAITSVLLCNCHATPKASESVASQPFDKSSSANDNKKFLSTAEQFIEEAEKTLAAMSVRANILNWEYETNISPETEKASADFGAQMSAVAVEYAQQAAKLSGDGLSADVQRKLLKLRLASTLAAPTNPLLNQELANLSTELNGMYGSGKGIFRGQTKDLGELSEIMQDMNVSPNSRLEAWQAWHEISRPMKTKYVRLVELANQGARELKFADTGDLWRSKYDMQPDEFSTEIDRLWGQVKPLYEKLHCYVRGKLNAKYGNEVIPNNGTLPAHVLGNMWAQSWGNLYELVAPSTGDFPQAINVTERLIAKSYDHRKMFNTAEGFYTSLGLRSLPASFWTNSMFVKPAGREVVCHASAWDVDNKDDVRVKMCTKVNDDDFVTIHHELGHNYYQMAYQNQPYLFQDSANDGFHEAIGDTIALSMTPKYLFQIGLIDQEPDATQEDIPFLLSRALDKVAFLPFALVVDQWRWKVFNGETNVQNYNKVWWELREKYQGVSSQFPRGEEFFDAAAKYHVAGNVPYTRYFLAAILQFQFYRSMCESTGHVGPLYRCSFFTNHEVGERLNRMLEMGASRPWQEALEVMTGAKNMDATAIGDYFAPLQKWLDKQIEISNYSCGW